MLLTAILLIPLLAGLAILPVRNETAARLTALAASLATLILILFIAFGKTSPELSVNWIGFLGIRFTLGYDGLSMAMLLLTGFLFPLVILAGFREGQVRPWVLNALILLTQSALIGLFLARSAFVFYVFWELALIPVYIILLIWGGADRAAITLKFFIYTLAGSLFLLFGIIYLYHATPEPHTTAFTAITGLAIPHNVQVWLFWVLFIAFAIKMPVFPFHTWQPPTYTMASTQGAMILAGLMTKMGIYGALRLLFPVVPDGVAFWQVPVIILCLTGMVYASVIAFRQNNLKRLIAYSSMAHISLMAAALFASNYLAYKGLMLQAVNHGVTVVALFYLASLVRHRFGTMEMNGMGGLKLSAPVLSVVLLIVVLGSIALPLTAGFTGEFLMIAGLFGRSVWLAAAGGLAMILGAVYMLYAYQRVMLGEANPALRIKTDLEVRDYLLLVPVILFIIGFGIFPQPVFDLVEKSIQSIISLSK